MRDCEGNEMRISIGFASALTVLGAGLLLLVQPALPQDSADAPPPVPVKISEAVLQNISSVTRRAPDKTTPSPIPGKM